jgi:hypothetical protein
MTGKTNTISAIYIMTIIIAIKHNRETSVDNNYDVKVIYFELYRIETKN